MYQVLQDNKACSSYAFKNFKQDTFKSFDEAKFYMVAYAYPFTKEDIESYLSNKEILLNVDYDMSMGETPVFMKIIEI